MINSCQREILVLKVISFNIPPGYGEAVHFAVGPKDLLLRPMDCLDKKESKIELKGWVIAFVMMKGVAGAIKVSP